MNCNLLNLYLLLLVCSGIHAQEIQLGSVSGPTGSLKAVARSEPFCCLLDLDVDSDNDNGFSLPDGSEWEEHIEDHKFSIGKLLVTGAPQRTPVVLRLNLAELDVGQDAEAALAKLRVRFDVVDSQGEIRLWDGPRGLADSGEEAGKRIRLGEAIPLDKLGFDVSKKIATIWVEAVKPVPGLATKTDVDETGRPNMFLRATLSEAGGKELGGDRVKYLPVAPGTFFPKLVSARIRPFRNSFAATLVNAAGGLDGTEQPFAPLESETLGLRLVTEEELHQALVAAEFDETHRAYIQDVLFYHTNSIQDPSRKGVRGLRIGLYRDYNSGDYTMAFQYPRKDNCIALYHTLPPYNFESRASGFIGHRDSAALLVTFLTDERHGLKLPGLRLTGVGVGGEIAVFAALGSGVPADTFNTKPIPVGMARLVLTREDPAQRIRIESVPGSLERLARANDYLSAYRINEVPYRVMPARFPLQPVP